MNWRNVQLPLVSGLHRILHSIVHKNLGPGGGLHLDLTLPE
jgi:hypothetical protein